MRHALTLNWCNSMIYSTLLDIAIPCSFRELAVLWHPSLGIWPCVGCFLALVTWFTDHYATLLKQYEICRLFALVINSNDYCKDISVDSVIFLLDENVWLTSSGSNCFIYFIYKRFCASFTTNKFSKILWVRLVTKNIIFY